MKQSLLQVAFSVNTSSSDCSVTRYTDERRCIGIMVHSTGMVKSMAKSFHPFQEKDLKTKTKVSNI